MNEFLPIILVLLAIFLLTRRWFWQAVFFFAGLAAFFSMLASIVHFQILAAIGFFILWWLLWAMLGAISTP